MRKINKNCVSVSNEARDVTLKRAKISPTHWWKPTIPSLIKIRSLSPGIKNGLQRPPSYWRRVGSMTSVYAVGLRPLVLSNVSNVTSRTTAASSRAYFKQYCSPQTCVKTLRGSKNLTESANFGVHIRTQHKPAILSAHMALNMHKWSLSSRRQHCVYFAQTPELSCVFQHISSLFSNQQQFNQTTGRPQSIASREDSTGNRREGKSLDIQHHSEGVCCPTRATPEHGLSDEAAKPFLHGQQ